MAGSVQRFIVTFWKALRLTLRGEVIESPAQQRFPTIFAWIRDARDALGTVDASLKAASVGEAAQKDVVTTIDGRTVSLHTVLAGVRYHLATEYRFLLEQPTDHALTALYATNLNDQYAVARFEASDAVPSTVQQALGQLRAVLEAIPPSQTADREQPAE